MVGSQLSLSHKNNFDFLRFLLASLVIFTHSFALMGDIRQDPIFPYTNRVLSEIAVCGFFVISGFLIQTSLGRSSTLKSFFKKRWLRIVPGLVVAVVTTALLIGAAATTLPLKNYFADTSVWKYIVSNVLLLPIQPTLPGVFADNAETAVNGSLWTLRYEVFYYLAIGSLYFFARINRKRIIALLALLYIVGFWLAKNGLVSHDSTVGKFLFYLCNLGAYFMTGAFLSFFTDKLFLHKTKWAILSGFIFLASSLIAQDVLLPLNMVAFSVFLISMGMHYTPLLHFSKYTGDISYGTYIYAYPLQQLLIVLLAPENAYQLMLPSFVCSWIAGWLSWHWIEKRFMQRK